jgi:signal transduction histidine kinase/CheY-like chemotaxis protein/CHASE1-domain containing sensor protein
LPHFTQRKIFFFSFMRSHVKKCEGNMTNYLKNLFSYLYQKKIFGFLILAFVFTAVASWLYLTSTIQTNINFRLERELNHITTSLNSNIYNYANTLGYVHAYFKTEGLPNEKTFRRLAESIEVQQVNHGIQGLGYISILKSRDLRKFIRQNKNRPFFKTDDFKEGQSLYAPLTMIEPLTRIRSKRLGYDMFQDDSRREAIYDAIKSSGMTLSKPLSPVSVTSKPEAFASLYLMLPYYKTIDIPATEGERLKKVQGLIYIPIRMREFFEAALGKPNLQNERVNFSLSYVNEKNNTETLLYQRFDQNKDENSLRKSRILDVYGHKWVVTITTFPQFFNFGDRYLANVVIFCFILFIGLLLSLFKQTENLLAHEKKTKDLMEATILQSREHTAKLKYLNEMNSPKDLETDLNSILKDFFHASHLISASSHAFLFCSQMVDADVDTISFFQAKGFATNELKTNDRTLLYINELIDTNIVLKRNPQAVSLFSQFINTPDTLNDWLLISIPSREFRRCGLLFLGREKSNQYSDIDLEIIESMASQLGVRIDNSRLFKKVEDANKVKTAFLSNMSHEIRTPLNAITGFSEILEQTQSPAVKHKLIEGIQKNTTQLTSIIDNILDISKIEFGRIFINKKVVSLVTLVKNIEIAMDIPAKAKSLHFQIEAIGPLPSEIETDESRVKQILINLIGNAIKFTEQGFVKLQIHFDSSQTMKPMLVFNIIDTGIGISTRSQLELFQSFTQIDISNTRRFGGIGLGLALSRRLAQQFGGEVSLVKSQLNQGSVFQLKISCGNLSKVKWLSNLTEELNKPQSVEPHLQSKKSIESKIKNKKILIVEDSEDNQEIFKYFLNSAGAIPEVTDNGEDAVIKAATSEFDLILMDIQLPKMDGLEATRRIRFAGYSKPIIALTAHASAEEKISCLKAGCIGLITKPVTQVTLIQKIQKILEENHVNS